MKNFENLPPPATLEMGRDRIFTVLVSISSLANLKGLPPHKLVPLHEQISKIKKEVLSHCKEKIKFDVDAVCAHLTEYINDNKGNQLDLSKEKAELRKALLDIQKFLK